MGNTTEAAKVLYTAKTHTSGGRQNGVSRSSDGRLEIKLSTPGSTGAGTNPEQLFAAGWSACFEGALAYAAQQLHTRLPKETAIDAEVDLLQGDDGFSLQARLNISLPGVDGDTAKQLVDIAEQTCPYSKAIKGNVNVEYNIV